MPSGRVRFETRSDGYERWRSWENGQDAYVYVHRLAAVAWGVLDDLGDDRHVHHKHSIPWLTTEDNIEAREPPDHAQHHLNRGVRT